MADQPNWWPFPWLNAFAPSQLSQSILPDLSLQHIDVNFAGNAPVEKDVVAKVASYGKQLGIITEAVLALAGDDPPTREARLDRLRALAAQVEKIKEAHQADLADNARNAMASLAKSDPAAATRIAADYAGKPGAARGK